ncbi:hypothetical protein PN456_22615 [Nodularia spumigena CS-586/05]|uniref:hypothetical protein n=1 Tax=Nodularia spumigena TaxID=70799 RepID=UPI00232C1C5E|nr:hypothetical protein [Nodularia spumigena]MDB9346120.1 hypothetical protein [Nodularia spumigena CS-588/06]MDB9371695.1 hypothetical protein [Nodularia spumigena CS-586/05]
MHKIQKILKNSDNFKFISLHYIYGKFGKSCLTFLLLLTSLFIKPAVAADYTDNNVVVENQPAQLNLDQNLKPSPRCQLNSESSISLRQRLLASKQKNPVAKSQPSIRDCLTVKIQPETFNNSFSVDNLVLPSENVLQTKDTINQQLLTDKKSNLDVQIQEQTNLPQQKEPETLAQIDSSGSVGDTFGDSDKLPQELFIDPILIRQKPSIKPKAQKAFPGSSAGNPSAYGASSGQVYIGLGVVVPLDEDSEGFVDGSYSAGFGLGDPIKSVGLEVNANFSSAGGDYLKGGEFDVGTSGYMGFKLHKYFPDGTAVALGWLNPVKWGESSNNQDTIYGVVTKAFPLQPNNPNHKLPLTISVGVGTGGFRSLGARAANENNANIFASLGLRVIPQASLVSSWTGNRLNIGSSITPFKNIPLIINAIVTDVTRNFDTGLGFSFSAGYSFRF